jgi:hypothetical protein
MTMLLLTMPVVTVAAFLAAALCAAIAWHTVHTARRQSAERVAALAAAIHGGPVVESFASEDGDAAAGSSMVHEGFRPAVIFGVGAAAVLAALAAVALWGMAAPAAAPRDRQPLELARLEYGVTGRAFTVSGAVTVPAGRPVRGLAVELVTLDRQGRALASGGAPVQQAGAPRGQLPFSVSVPYTGAVDRYTIRFRDASGLRPHVDRRVKGGTR